jgi:hypothetical protein
METVEKNLKLFCKMKELALKQQTSLEEDRLDLFSQLSRERERIRSKITIHQTATVLSKGKKGGQAEADSRKRAMEILEVIQVIQDIDTRIRETLLRKKDALVTEIREIRKGKKAVRGYGKRFMRPAKFVDQKS